MSDGLNSYVTHKLRSLHHSLVLRVILDACTSGSVLATIPIPTEVTM